MHLMRTRLAPPLRSKSRGLTLIEVLVALLVLSFGLLGLAMMQTAGLRFASDSYSRSQATFFAYDIIERMRVNPTGFAAGNYDVADASDAEAAISAYETCLSGGTCDCNSAACAPATLAQYDLGQWYELQDKLLTGALPAANADERSTIERLGSVATITLRWYEQDDLKTQTWVVEF